MASLYERTDSPFYWIAYRDSLGRLCQESTRLRTDVAGDVRKARALVAQRTADELARGFGVRGRTKPTGWGWVTDFLRVKYSHGTLLRMNNSWRMLSLFFEKEGINSPTAVSRQHCYKYVGWRTSEDLVNGKYAACHNTALFDLHILSIIMQEAINRDLAEANCCLRLGIKQQEVRRKPELTETDIAIIRKAIPKVSNPEVRAMLHASFEIARYQGCRLNETRINLREDVDFKSRRITFKTKTRKAHTTKLHPTIVPLLRQLIARGKTHTWELPEGATATWAAKKWHQLLVSLGLQQRGISFHCTRVTVITELARNNVSRQKAMAFVAHSSPAVNAIYTRLNPDDLSDCTKAIG